jgi:site-specific recombinase XerD
VLSNKLLPIADWRTLRHTTFAAHARACVTKAGGELEQIQFLLGHVSVQTTERYLGCKQRLRNAVNDNIGLEPEG